jgi:hypothetical protein
VGWWRDEGYLEALGDYVGVGDHYLFSCQLSPLPFPPGLFIWNQNEKEDSQP